MEIWDVKQIILRFIPGVTTLQIFFCVTFLKYYKLLFVLAYANQYLISYTLYCNLTICTQIHYYTLVLLFVTFPLFHLSNHLSLSVSLSFSLSPSLSHSLCIFSPLGVFWLNWLWEVVRNKFLLASPTKLIFISPISFQLQRMQKMTVRLFKYLSKEIISEIAKI